MLKRSSRNHIIPMIAACVMISLIFQAGCGSATPSPSTLPPITISPTVTGIAGEVTPVSRTPGNSPISPSPTSNPSLSDSISATVKKIGPSVVMVLSQGVDWSHYLQPVPQNGAGSGFILTPDGYIVTNYHVVEKASSIKVYLPDGRLLDATVQGADPFTDIAVVKIDAQNLPSINFGDSSKLDIGQPVVAIGNAFALPGGYSVTSGIISAVDRSIQIGDNPILHGLLQTDAAINPGNSGGPLVTLDGDVIGVNTAMIGGGQNIGFAISSAVAQPVAEHLIKHGQIIWPWLGIDTLTLTPLLSEELRLPDIEGVAIVRVFDGGPASKAGLKNKDIILALNTTQVKSDIQLEEETRKYTVGDQVQVKYVEDGQTRTATVTLEQTPSNY